MRLGWRLLWRDIRRGEIWLLLAALVLAVAATTSLRFFSTSLDQGLRQQAASLIAADLVLSSSRPLRPAALETAAKLKLDHAELLEFSTVLQAGNGFQLSSIKAVSAGYPLRGQLAIHQGAAVFASRAAPSPGTIWVEERLLDLLKVKLGDTLQFGDSQLRIAAVIVQEPDRGGNFASFSPRALVNIGDIGAAHVIQPGSRIQYRLLLAGRPDAVAGFSKTMRSRLGPGEKLLDVANGRPEIGKPLTQAANYLSLAAIAAVLLAGVAVGLSARRFSERHYDTLALFRCLGATAPRIRQLYFQQLLAIWLAAIILGALLGLGASLLLFGLLQNLLPVNTLEFTFAEPLLTGMATATLTLLGFALPAFLSLLRVSPLRVLRRELAPASLSTLSITALALGSLFLLLALETGRWLLTGIVVVGGGLLTLILGGVLWLALRHWRRRPAAKGPRRYWRLGLRELLRNPRATITQVLGFALGMTAMLLVFSLRGELLTAWQSKLPEGAPNQFALGIPSDRMQEFSTSLEASGFRHAELYPVVRARLTAVNGKPVTRRVSKEEDGKNEEALNRELNLTTATRLPASNKILNGQWWRADMKNPVSVESRLAERLNIHLGDRLRFSMPEGELEATVTSLREVDWESFQPNFYMVFPPATLQGLPTSYLTSFHVTPEQKPQLNALVRQFPTVVLIDVAAVMGQVRTLLDQVSRAVEFILAFVLVAGVLVLLACVAASMDQRRQEAALLRALGASKRQLQLRLGVEMLGLGALSGLLAVLLTEVIAAVLYVRVLDTAPVLHPLLWLSTPLLGALLTAATGLLATRQVWTVEPVTVLRQD